MVGFKGLTQEKSPSEIFRFSCGKASNDKKVPDRVGSGVFVLDKWRLLVRPRGYIQKNSSPCRPVFGRRAFVTDEDLGVFTKSFV
jgi:hypothetical protein